MKTAVVNLLYRRPELYEFVYPEPDRSTPLFCQSAFRRHLGRNPESLLDVGCGTGRDLGVLAEGCGDCYGVDILPGMIDFARRAHPAITWSVADMRNVCLEKTFDGILCLGGVLTYALTDDDLDRTLATLRLHAHAGTVLIADLMNAAAFLPGGDGQCQRQFRVHAPGFAADVEVKHEFCRRRQTVVRHRRWTLDDGSVEDDYCEYCMLFPAELERRLRQYGYEIVDMFDNKAFLDTALTGVTLYVIAVCRDAGHYPVAADGHAPSLRLVACPQQNSLPLCGREPGRSIRRDHVATVPTCGNLIHSLQRHWTFRRISGRSSRCGWQRAWSRPPAPNAEEAWAAEIARRVERLRAGTARTVSAQEALARARAKLAADRG